MKNWSFARILLFLLTGAITLAVSLTWEVTYRLSQVMEASKYWVLSVEFLLGGLTILVLMLGVERRYPRLSMKLFQAAITIGICCYFLPGVTTFYSMRFMSPGVAALTIALVPLWLWIYKMGNWRKKLPALLICSVGVGLFFWGSTPTINTREIFILLVLFVASFFYATGLSFTRRIFWMHYGLELNLWAMLFASCLFGLMSVLFYEPRVVPESFDNHFMLYLAILSVLILGIGTFFYRYVAHHPRLTSMMTLTLGIPFLGVACTWISSASHTPHNLPCLLGVAIVLVTLGATGVGEPSAVWMTHFLTNTRRVGERVVCLLNGFVRVDKGPLVKIEIVDLSMGGLGFKCDDTIQVGDRALVSIPLGEGWTQLSVEAQIVHAVKSTVPGKPTQGRWQGGLQFSNIPEDRLQPLVEFLAGMGRH